jgi:hypothetical protein
MRRSEGEEKARTQANKPSAKFLEVLSKVDRTIDDLLLAHELSQGNAQTLERLTQRLYSDLIDNKERTRIASDLRTAVDQILSFSAVGDQLLAKSQELQERFPEELGNVSFDFIDFRAFKYLALKDALDALQMLSTHGYRKEVQSILALAELRMVQFTLHDSVNQLQEAISEMMIQVHKRENPDNFSREKFAGLLKELEIARLETQKFSDKHVATKKKLRKEREMNSTLLHSLERAREDFNLERQKTQVEMERRNQELAKLRGIGHDHALLLREMESLRAQLSVERERAARLQTKYDLLMRGQEG